MSDGPDVDGLDLGPLASLLAALLRQGEPVLLATVTPANAGRVLPLLKRCKYVLFTKLPLSDTVQP